MSAAKPVRPEGTRKAEVVQVVRTYSGRGYGEPGDPFRLVVQYWSFDGTLLAEHDPTTETP